MIIEKAGSANDNNTIVTIATNTTLSFVTSVLTKQEVLLDL